MSSTRACLALSRGIDFAGLGDQYSVAEVWRTSTCSPGADLVAILMNRLAGNRGGGSENRASEKLVGEH